jgi:hypothetical protein
MPHPAPPAPPAPPGTGGGSSSSDDILHFIQAVLLQGGSVLPRRVVVKADGTLAERRDHPALPEVTVISLVCETLMKNAGVSFAPRHTDHLLRQCLKDNCHVAWRGLLDDALTSDLDVGVVRATIAEEINMASLVSCVCGATGGMHLWLVVKGLGVLLSDPIHRRRFTQELSSPRNIAGVLAILVKHHRDISSEEQEAVTRALAHLIDWAAIPPCEMLGLLRFCIDRHTGCDLLHLFFNAPSGYLAMAEPDLVTALLEKAEATQLDLKYPPCALLAAMTTQQLGSHKDRVLALVTQVMRIANSKQSVYVALARVCGALVCKVSGSDAGSGAGSDAGSGAGSDAGSGAGSVGVMMSHMVCCLATELLTGQCVTPRM